MIVLAIKLWVIDSGGDSSQDRKTDASNDGESSEARSKVDAESNSDELEKLSHVYSPVEFLIKIYFYLMQVCQTDANFQGIIWGFENFESITRANFGLNEVEELCQGFEATDMNLPV